MMKNNVPHQAIEFILSSVKFGYFSGIIGGYLIDTVPPWKTFLMAGFLSFCSMQALGTFCFTDFNPIISVFSTFFLFLSGLCGSMVSMLAAITVIRNFVPKYSPLILLILVTYMKLAFEWDESMRKGIFGRWEATGYIFCSGFVQFGVYIVAAIMLRVAPQYVFVQMFTEK